MSAGRLGCASPLDYLIWLNVVLSDDVVSNLLHNANHGLWVYIARRVIQPLQEVRKAPSDDRVQLRHDLRLDKWPPGLLVPDVPDAFVSEIRDAALTDCLIEFATDRCSLRREDRVVLFMDLQPL